MCTPRRRLLLLAFCALAIAPLSSCERDSDGAALPAARKLDDSLNAAQLDALHSALRGLIADDDAASLRPTSLIPASQDELSDLDLEVLRALYEAHGDVALWTTPEGQLSDPGQAVLAMLERAWEEQAIAPGTLGLPSVHSALALRASLGDPPQLTLTEQEIVTVRAWLSAQDASHRVAGALASALLSPQSPLPRLTSVAAAARQRAATRTQARADAELAMARAMLRFARIVRLDNPAWQRARVWPAELMPAEGARPSPEQLRARDVLIRREALSPAWADPTSAAAVLAALEPHFEGYQRLKQAHARYVTLRDAGGWQTVPASLVDLQPGGEHEAIPALKARLRAEGYWAGDDSTRFDSALSKALDLYHHTHQLWEKGVVSDITRRSMNVPVERRLFQLRIALQAWRDSRVGADSHYIHVNVPDFHTEIWDAGERKRRFRVVTGASKREWDAKNRAWVHPQATTLFSDAMEYIVFNPYWNVPQNILNSELLPKLKEDPEHFTKNNYEWYETSPGNRIVRQKPGPLNALGVVKFLFPNVHDIYLHDSPQKEYLDYPVRAFSHGCVRVDEPLALARYLLEREGRWSEALEQKWLKSPSEVWLKLQTPVPIHIEYIGVRVADDGQPHFLVDIYRKEAEPAAAVAAEDRATLILQQAMAHSAPGEVVAAALPAR